MAGNFQAFQWLDVKHLPFFITFLISAMIQTFF